MPFYEHVVLVRQDASQAQAEAITENLKSIIEKNDGKVVRVESWGLKNLAYRIRKNRKAHYTLLNIDAPHAVVAEMERQEKINEDIIRFMTVRVEKIENGPSAMLLRKEKEDRYRSEEEFVPNLENA